jgi:hypothetical protein
MRVLFYPFSILFPPSQSSTDDEQLDDGYNKYRLALKGERGHT